MAKGQYYCRKCKTTHEASSKIGRRHRIDAIKKGARAYRYQAPL